jgi:hypothetical protein
MTKSDLKQIKDLIDTALKAHLATVHDEIYDLAIDVTAMCGDLADRIDHLEAKLSKFEEHDIEKRHQLEVFARIVKHMGTSI